MARVFVVSDLARQRRQVVNAARLDPVRIRDADGETLILKSEDHELLRDRAIVLYQLLARAAVECRRGEPSSVVLGELSYLASWSVVRRESFLDALAEAIAESLRQGSSVPADDLIARSAPDSEPLPVTESREFQQRFADAVRAARPRAAVPHAAA